MGKLKNELPDASKWCHIYRDSEDVTTIHDTENNETYRIIPALEHFGFYIEYFAGSKLKARNSFSFEEMKALAQLAGSNNELLKLKGGENND